MSATMEHVKFDETLPPNFSWLIFSPFVFRACEAPASSGSPNSCNFWWIWSSESREVRGNAGTCLHQDCRKRQDDQGSRAADRSGPELDDHRAVLRGDRDQPRDRDEEAGPRPRVISNADCVAKFAPAPQP